MRLFVLMLLMISGSRAEVEKKTVEEPRNHHLVQVRDGADVRFIRETGTLRPERIYSIFFPDLSKTYYVLTTAQGRIPDPLEVFLAGSVVRGAFIGGNPDRFYRLNERLVWESSDRTHERHLLWTRNPDGRPREFSRTFPGTDKKGH